MNERIKQLFEQAHERKPIIVMDHETCEPTHKLGHGSVPMYHIVFNPEKFAELIVRECVEVCADRGTHHDGLYSAWAEDCSKRIAKHFGVEESKPQFICPKCGVDRFSVDCPNPNRLECGIKVEAQ